MAVVVLVGRNGVRYVFQFCDSQEVCPMDSSGLSLLGPLALQPTTTPQRSTMLPIRPFGPMQGRGTWQ